MSVAPFTNEGPGMRQRGMVGVARRSQPEVVFLAVVLLLGVLVVPAHAHEGKLPPDALSLVRQAAALLAQDPGMLAEVRERLDAALVSKDTRGVDLAKVRLAREVLAGRDIPGARRALAEAVMPASAVPLPASPPMAGTSPGPMPLTPSPSGASPQPAAGPSSADPLAAMKTAEPLVVRFGASFGETATLVVGLALVAVGLAALRRGR